MTGPSPTPVALDAHLRSLAVTRLSRLLDCRKYWTQADPVEAVHDARVASRRLRALLDVFEPVMDAGAHDRARRALRRVTRGLGELRDRDVQIATLGKHHRHTESATERAAIEHVLVLTNLGRRKIERRARKRLERIDFHSLSEAVHVAVTDVTARLPPPGIETSLLALSLLTPFVDAAEREAPRDPATADPEGLHQLRIALKKVRYGVELVQPLFGEQYRKLHREIERLQEVLGNHHDVRVLAALAEDAKSELARLALPTIATGLDEFRERLRREESDALARFRERPFDGPAYRKKVEAALLGSGPTAA